MNTTRFQIHSQTGVEPLKHDAALSLAITRAVTSPEEGEWIVTEYDDAVYKVTRTEKGDIFIEDLA